MMSNPHLRLTRSSPSGLTRWSFVTERYFGPHENRDVKDVDSMNIRLLPLESWAAQPPHKLRYTVVGV